jgi:hypothetical protein
MPRLLRYRCAALGLASLGNPARVSTADSTEHGPRDEGDGGNEGGGNEDVVARSTLVLSMRIETHPDHSCVRSETRPHQLR